MHRIQLPAFACVSLLLGTAAGASAGVPDWIPPPANGGQAPIWMSAGEATTPEGQIRSELFGPVEASNLERLLKTQRDARAQNGIETKEGGDPCPSWIFVPPSPVLEDLSLEGLLGYARLAIVGTVLDQKEGFYRGHPNSLLEVRVDKVLKAAPDLNVTTSVLVTFPEVEMKVGDELVCMRSDRYPSRPLTGKGILVFAANIPDQEPLIVAPNTEVVLFEDEGGRTSLPARLGPVLDPPSWKEMVKRAVQAASLVGSFSERRL